MEHAIKRWHSPKWHTRLKAEQFTQSAKIDLRSFCAHVKICMEYWRVRFGNTFKKPYSNFERTISINSLFDFKLLKSTGF